MNQGYGPYKKGDKVRLISNNDSYAKHPTEKRDLKKGDIVIVDSWDDIDTAIIFKIDYSSDNDGGKIWLIIDSVELVDGSTTPNSGGDCTCDMMELMRVGCKCGAITRHKDK